MSSKNKKQKTKTKQQQQKNKHKNKNQNKTKKTLKKCRYGVCDISSKFNLCTATERRKREKKKEIGNSPEG